MKRKKKRSVLDAHGKERGSQFFFKNLQPFVTSVLHEEGKKPKKLSSLLSLMWIYREEKEEKNKPLSLIFMSLLLLNKEQKVKKEETNTKKRVPSTLLCLSLSRFVFLTAEEVVLLVRETDDGWCVWFDGCLFGSWQFKGSLGRLQFGGRCGSMFALGVVVWRVRWCLEVIMVVCSGCWWMVFVGEERWVKWWRGEMREVEVSLRWWWWLDVIMRRWLCWWWKLSRWQGRVVLQVVAVVCEGEGWRLYEVYGCWDIEGGVRWVVV